MDNRVALVTGGARRLGAAIVDAMHARGCDVVIHYRESKEEARNLQTMLQHRRANSVYVVQADLQDVRCVAALVQECVGWRGRLDVLVNSASTFFPTPVGDVTLEQWDDLMGSNLRAPFFLAQEASPALRQQAGCIVNLLDIFASRPMPTHPVYSAAKAGLQMLTRSLALELSPDVRVNGVAPGAILWPEKNPDPHEMQSILDRVPMQRTGEPEDIASAVSYLALDAPYVTGQVLAVDGGRSLNM